MTEINPELHRDGTENLSDDNFQEFSEFDKTFENSKCPKCNRLTIYDEDRDDNGTVTNNWYYCEDCNYTFRDSSLD